MQIDEAELIAQSISGDTAAYGQLVDRYKNAVYHHCFAIVRDEDAAEDIAQDTFIAAYYNLRKYNPTFKLATWLFKIGTNKCLNYLKQQAKFVQQGDEALATIASTHTTPHRDALDDELHRAVDALQPKHRAVISLYYWQGMSITETALVMDAPEGSVKVWMKRAKEQLRKELS